MPPNGVVRQLSWPRSRVQSHRPSEIFPFVNRLPRTLLHKEHPVTLVSRRRADGGRPQIQCHALDSNNVNLWLTRWRELRAQHTVSPGMCLTTIKGHPSEGSVPTFVDVVESRGRVRSIGLFHRWPCKFLPSRRIECDCACPRILSTDLLIRAAAVIEAYPCEDICRASVITLPETAVGTARSAHFPGNNSERNSPHTKSGIAISYAPSITISPWLTMFANHTRTYDGGVG